MTTNTSPLQPSTSCPPAPSASHSWSRLAVPAAVVDLLSFLVVGLSIACLFLVSKFHDSSHGTPTILFLGDSVTERARNVELMGWHFSSRKTTPHRHDQPRRGGMDNPVQLDLALLPALLDEWGHQPPVLTAIFLGTNDASTSLHLPIADYEANLIQLVTRVQSTWQCRVLLVTPPPIDDERASVAWRGRLFTNAEVGRYSVGDRLHVPVEAVYPEFVPSALHWQHAGDCSNDKIRRLRTLAGPITSRSECLSQDI
ncbi:Aste57867_15227 [Aphanomyces stellatus]|uniref:Aste57867_15227 protein n=1 Tax=Aphanomyces stellatus TaxID=120398 RepID=A0A485L2X8_9STRA|nr:hypothetical protein As57867_015171 [Aphanomyces stellatus]VFT92036.1 Aste57867_15227 [Aphanomyces stellatus]